ncbi:hypothetical protein HER32_17350 [Hymenobacter sp. BT18]|uniref:hypothetical protein n=1 Tax=Hymenobacter sp. BT18 TaxID=2835648 RepID=UPI00143E1FDB|nr:hypothetical protein [Hymenobacter sp. BT18]QIX62843.1 hypothetical protein HER32_17350 [Hymenobacter sp. BT18]
MFTHRTLLFTALAAMLGTPVFAQHLEVEKTHDVSGKAKRGYLSEVNVNNEAGKVDMLFVTKSTDKQVATQTYHFDTKYNLLGIDEATIPMEKVKGYRGENFSKEAVTMEVSTGMAGGAASMIPGASFVSALKNPAGTLLLRRKRIDYKWSWLGGGYRKKVKLLNTEKPKTESGAGYHYLSHVDDDVNGGVLVLASENVKLSNVKGMKIGLHLLYFNSQLELARDTYLETDVAQSFVEMGPIALDTDEDADDSQLTVAPDVAIMLAYTKGAGKLKDAHKATDYQYLRVSADGQVKEKLAVNSPNSGWQVAGFVPMADGGVLAYGPAIDDQKKFHAEVPTGDEFKGKHFQLLKVQQGRVAWLTATDLKEFEKKQRVPEGQKRTPDYTGKRFRINLASETPNGDIFVGGQNYKVSGGGNKMLNTLANGRASGNDAIETTYGDLLLFHFDKQGQLRAQYGLRRAENNSTAKAMPTGQFMRATPDAKSVYWIVQELDGFRTVNGLTEDGARGGLFEPTQRETISYPSVTRIELASATISAQKTFGVSKEGKYYMSNKFPLLPVGDGGRQVVFFGENKTGKTLWFGQMPLE